MAQGKGPQPLTQEVILSSTNVPRGNLSLDAFNQKLTHLQLQGKRLGPDLQRLDLVPAVYVVYGYDNLISSLHGIESLRRLQVLYLQNNRLENLAGIEVLHLLKKLHLGGNMLTRIEGLENATQLEDLSVPNQRPPNWDLPLEFCPNSMMAIAPSLNILDAAGNCLEDVSSLVCLTRLSSLDLSDNRLQQVGDLRPILSGHFLRKVMLKGNPFSSQGRRYRSMVVLSSSTLEEIDGRPVLPQELDFVKRLDEQKRKLTAQRSRHIARVASDAAPRMLSPTDLLKADPFTDPGGAAQNAPPPVLQDLVNR